MEFPSKMKFSPDLISELKKEFACEELETMLNNGENVSALTFCKQKSKTTDAFALDQEGILDLAIKAGNHEIAKVAKKIIHRKNLLKRMAEELVTITQAKNSSKYSNIGHSPYY